MAFAWTNIAADETKVNAPDGQTLNDKYRGNLDNIRARVRDTPTDADWVTQNHIKNNAVGQGELKTTVQEYSTVVGSANVVAQIVNNVAPGASTAYISLTSTPGGGGGNVAINNNQYNFYPRIRYNAFNAYAQFRWITSSRDEPIFWILRNKKTKYIKMASFDPESQMNFHPFIDYENELPNDLEILCIQIKDNQKLKEHLYKNFYIEESFLYQLYLGLWSGDIILKGESKPRLKLKTNDTENLKKLGLEDKKIAPCLYHKDIKLVGLEFNL